jgi:hypothetical protein
LGTGLTALTALGAAFGAGLDAGSEWAFSADFALEGFGDSVTAECGCALLGADVFWDAARDEAVVAAAAFFVGSAARRASEVFVAAFEVVVLTTASLSFFFASGATTFVGTIGLSCHGEVARH